MAYKPMLFNSEMVKAICEGRKTQTRRIIKLTEGFTGRPVGESGNPGNPIGFMYPCGIKRPPCNPGDILWVRETWRKDVGRYMYKASYTDDEKFYRNGIEVLLKWRPAIHMPREAARIFLRVQNVRVERLREIHEKYEPGPSNPVLQEGFHYLHEFIATWENTVKPADRIRYGWNANPWVWVIEFERCEKPEGWCANNGKEADEPQ